MATEKSKTPPVPTPDEETASSTVSGRDPEVTAEMEPGGQSDLAAEMLAAEDTQVTLSGACTVHAQSLSASGSAIGVASVDGDTTITASLAPIVVSRGNTMVRQSYTSGVIVGGGANTMMHQSFAPLIIGKTMDVTQSGGCVLASSEASIKQSWIGMVVAPNVTVSEDSRVLLSTRAALIVAAALLGGMGLIALAIGLASSNARRRRPTFARSLPSLPSLPDLSPIAEKLKGLRGDIKDHPAIADLAAIVQDKIARASRRSA